MYQWYYLYMDKQVPVSEAREEFGRLVDAAHFQDDWTVITKNGEARAVIVSYEWYREAEGRRDQMLKEKQ